MANENNTIDLRPPYGPSQNQYVSLPQKPNSEEGFKECIDYLPAQSEHIEEDVKELFRFLDLHQNGLIGRIIDYTYNHYTGVIPKSKLNRWLTESHFTHSKDDESNTLKEITDRIVNELLQEFDIITLNDTKQIMLFQGNSFTFNTDPLIESISNKISMLTKGSYRTYKANILEELKDKTLFDRDNFCQDPWIINFKNGYYDVISDAFFPLTSSKCQELKIFYEIPWEFQEGNYSCFKFKQACRRWFEKKILLNDIFEMIGFTLSMNTSFKASFINYGKKDSGKTQFTNILTTLVGRDNLSAISLQRLEMRFGTNGLQFKIANICGDLPAKPLKDHGIYKSLTGDDEYIGGEIKGGAQYEFRNYATFWFNANQIPKIEDVNDMAFFDRFILNRFAHEFTFEKKNKINRFFEQITTDPTEMQGIIHEGIKGLQRLHDRGEFRPILKENTKHVWLYESDPLYAFLFDNTIRDPSGEIEDESFIAQFNEETGQAYNKRDATIDLQRFNISHKKRRLSGSQFDWVYRGIRWKDEPISLTIEGILTKERAVE